MNIIRDYVRSLLLEIVAIDADIFVKKLRKFSDTLSHPEHLDLGGNFRFYAQHHNLVIIEIEHTPYPAPKPKPVPNFDTHKEKLAWFQSPEGKAWRTENLYWRPPKIDRDYIKKWHKDVIAHLEKQYTQFASARGWNILQTTSKIQPIFGPTPIVMTRIWFDQKPNINVSGILGTAPELQESYHLYHMTTSSVAEKIMSSGFKVPKKSTDGKMFGNGRAYFVAIEKDVPEKEIIEFFREMQSKSGFAGKENLDSVIKIGISKIKGNIKFYKDTEWSKGSGIIPTQNTNIIAIATWTPTFIKSDSIIEVINL